MRMVKFIAILYCLFFVFGTAVAQDTIIPDGRKWIMREYNVNPFTSVNNVVTCVVNGDTTLQGYAYKKVHFVKNNNAETADISMLVRCDGSKIYQRYGTYGKWGPDRLVFDENLQVGDTLPFLITTELYANITSIGELQGRKYWNVFDWFIWLKGVGYINTLMFFDTYSGMTGNNLYSLICCIDPGNDTLYVNRDLLHLLETNIENISASEVSFTQQGNECIVTLPADVAAWEATLSNSVGVTVARCSGEGSEVILPATSKGTHILVVNADGRVVKKKVYIK